MKLFALLVVVICCVVVPTESHAFNMMAWCYGPTQPPCQAQQCFPQNYNWQQVQTWCHGKCGPSAWINGFFESSNCGGGQRTKRSTQK
jgi:hypothetical protein